MDDGWMDGWMDILVFFVSKFKHPVTSQSQQMNKNANTFLFFSVKDDH